ncbi:hypothetical protein [Olleya sp. UBA1516]|uniref:hypothetical protein n=1 Tax=Olleya sp. UBA1516 TaxID=1947013 RepID=UPI0025E7FFA3|nr:hypothetical protein [Olleya sp. UBA1516]|tara:strand:- start:1918 stop:2745 length:828 start_codon:yes stop_codon:yes gene_type:complete
MKTLKYLFLCISITLFTNCSDDDASEQITSIASEIFNIEAFGDSNIFGTIEYFKNSNSTITIEVNLVGTETNQFYPAKIAFDTAADYDGANSQVAINLVPIDGNSGKSRTTFSKLEDGTTISYEALLDFDGNIVINQSETSNVIVTQSDIGQNILTTNTFSYPLSEVDVSDISGTITFTERVNGEALAEISLIGSPEGGVHPAHIHSGSVATAPGAIAFTFNPVVSRISKTNVAQLDNGTPFGFDDVFTVNGYVNVHLSATNLGVILAQGNIGAN